METLTAYEAENSFGDTLIKAQRSPVQITKSGKPVAVLVSIENYRMTEELKMQVLKERVLRAESDLQAGNFVDGEDFMQDLITGKHD
ncbi:MAG: type II toxin-antitoxin system prevent-host-death family antitoxin [Synergistaceae bacterium]|nr:type II toxin-antitoxin system prevent-host-death family antitoxin [Synergistaceae bacterium]